MPVKAFADAKARLAPVLDPSTRAALAEWSATRVVHAAHGLRVVVACDDHQVATWAESLGAEVAWCPGLGLDGAVMRGVRHVASSGADHVVVAHSDLPLASDLRPLADEGGLTLVPDGPRDGTNILAFPVDCGLEVAYGKGSFARHLGRALATGRPVRVVHHHALALDLDTPRDLTHPLVQEVLPPWLPTNPANLLPTR